MKLNTILDKLCCPFDNHDLDLKIVTMDENTFVLEGILSCKECRRIYPIISGIPIMTPDEFRELSLEKPHLDEWQRFIDGNMMDDKFRLKDKV